MPIRGVMPTFAAMLVASIAGWAVEGPIRAGVGPIASMAASFLVSVLVFFFAKRFLSDLRG
jgi:hypothetical protein